MARSGWSSRVWAGIWSLLLCLVIGACQPYPDHEETLVDFRADRVDFGVRRELNVVDHRGDHESLLLVFNQPLQDWDSDGEQAPFIPSFLPKVRVAEVVREGAAGIRVHFAQELPPARSYQAKIPTGWRALTGAAMVRSRTVSWETERPKLLGISCEGGLANWTPEKPLLLSFNQEIEESSLRGILQLSKVADGSSLETWELEPSPENPEQVRLLLSSVPEAARMRLAIEPGLRSASGTLESLETGQWDFGPPLELSCLTPSVLPVGTGKFPRLAFSSELELENLQRHLKGLDWRRIRLESEDGKTFALVWNGEPPEEPLEFELLAGLVSLDGRALQESHHFTLLPASREKSRPRAKLRPYRSLAKSATVLELSTPKDLEVVTWSLSRRQFLELLQGESKRWRQGKKLPVELSEPVFRHKTTKARSRTRFLKAESKWTEKRPFGAFLLRLSKDGKFQRRLLVLRSELKPRAVSLNGLVKVKLERAGVRAEVLDKKLKVRASALSDEKGEAVLSDVREEFAQLLLLRSGQDYQVSALRAVSLETPELTPGMVWANGAVFETSQPVTFFGVWWEDGEPSLQLLDSFDRVVTSSTDIQHSDGFFRGTLRAPEEPGRYHFRFPGFSDSETSFGFVVTDHPVLPDHPSTLTLESTEEGFRGAFSWDGPGANHLALRALLRPRVERVEGWTIEKQGSPHRLPVELELELSAGGGRYSLEELPDLEGAWELVVELYDSRDQVRVFRRVSTRLGSEPIALSGVESRTDSSGSRLVKFRFSASTEDIEELQCRLEVRRRQGWVELSEGVAEGVEGGVFEWPATLGTGQNFRLTSTYRWQGRRQESSYSANFPVWHQSWSPLQVSEETVVEGQNLGVSWNGEVKSKEFWVGLFVGARLEFLELRELSSGGGLGSIQIPELHPGTSELLVFATDGLAAWRTARLKVNRENEVATGETRLDGEAEPTLVKAEEPILLSFGEEPVEQALVWWEQQTDSGSELAAEPPWEQLQESVEHPFTTLHGNVRGQVIGPLAEVSEVPLQAPSTPGHFTLHVLWSTEGRLHFAEHGLEVKASAHWRALLPSFVRWGDHFSAGVRFWSDPDLVTPTGATVSVELESELLPESYYSTAALVDPGSFGDMLFSYQAPPTFWESEGYTLNWELGVEGEAWPVQVLLEPRAMESFEELFRTRTLSQGGIRANLVGAEHWRIQLTSKEGAAETALRLSGEGFESLELSLTPERATRSLFYTGSGNFQFEHLSGETAEIEIYRVVPLRPDRVATAAYLLSRLLQDDGTPLEQRGEVGLGEDFLFMAHLVVPEELGKSRLVVPIPGAVEPLGCWLQELEGVTPLDWEHSEGRVDIRLPELPPGEHRVQLELGADVPGDFGWPGASLLDEAGNDVAKERSFRLRVETP